MSAELQIDTNATAMQMAQAIFGTGVTVNSATYTGAVGASGIYSGGLATAGDILHSDTGVILSTGRVTDFTSGPDPNTNPGGDPNLSSGTSTVWNTAGNTNLTSMAGSQTYDAAILEATFTPIGNMLTMQIVFSSEEYLEYVNSGFNDIVAIWVNGQKAELTVGSGDISINNINNVSNQNLYVDNPVDGGTFNTEMDGFTVVLTLKAPVIPNQPNTISFAIADAGDAWYDSNLVILGDSVQVALVADDDMISLRKNTTGDFDLRANDFSWMGGSLTITHINGIEVQAGDTVILPTGEAITLNADGTITTTGMDVHQTSVFSYTVENANGDSDVAFVTLATAPCFVAGTLIDVPGGKTKVEDLVPGDLVVTRDHGAQPLRWIGKTRRIARGADAPVRLAAGALGRHGPMRLSRNHRVLVSGPASELLFGQPECLVKVGHLINDSTIRPVADGRTVTYVHLLFDRHEIVCANGLPAESYHPGDGSLALLDPESRDEVLRLFPELRPTGGRAYGPTARPVLRQHEAALISRRPAAGALNRAAIR